MQRNYIVLRMLLGMTEHNQCNVPCKKTSTTSVRRPWFGPECLRQMSKWKIVGATCWGCGQWPELKICQGVQLYGWRFFERPIGVGLVILTLV